ncbi:reverse transcriptase [Caerostris extrusa]|uniref:Reverse transcriptase n=1 Tax=Caerostris extrusa TaxID=172846 RepID=A0AAV4VX65_CAEEX|nr:reverse transcriptase [Caerostris extrusa]
MTESRDILWFLLTDDPTDESKAPQIYMLFGVNSSPFMFAVTSPLCHKHHLRKYENNYPETGEFLNNSIYVDNIVGGHQNDERVYNTYLECMHMFKEAAMTTLMVNQ